MSLQLLDYFFGLQVPNVDHVVFTARNDPFATGNGEIGKNTVFFVFMTGVGFETFAFGIVPQLQRVVQGGLVVRLQQEAAGPVPQPGHGAPHQLSPHAPGQVGLQVSRPQRGARQAPGRLQPGQVLSPRHH